MYVNGFEQQACIACDAGTYASKRGQPTCDECKPGRYSKEDGANQCDICPAGKYSELDKCVSCPAGMASDEGSTDASDCQSPTVSFVAGDRKSTRLNSSH